MTTPTVDRLTSTNRLMAPFALSMVAANGVLQVIIVLTGQEIGVLAGALTGLIALGYAGFLVKFGQDLRKVRYGGLAAHAITYASVNTGFGLHFFVIALAGGPGVEGGGDFVLDGGWFGAAIAMPALWGVGLVLHGLGAAAGRGFEASG